jgi:hypothetical protein
MSTDEKVLKLLEDLQAGQKALQDDVSAVKAETGKIPAIEQRLDHHGKLLTGLQQLPLYPKDPIRPMSAGSRGAHCVPQESRLTPPAHRESKQGMILWNFWPPLG